uniref:non-specific serine/threonine protein kinase n=1 Tax=Candidatus Kentrum sp. TUN TaxID=2126343 RepID=A0A450ZY18_9GAMM|nr:MAG: GTPase SAR1 family protein [Candidatus Kentron sp. TUN]VFK58646.1 MAG: GTPase SAR1 family protein [Candidatus Kentron sp. TUN]
MTDKTKQAINIKEFRKEVRTRLEEIRDPRRSAAFAGRMALMALPGLALTDEQAVRGKHFLWFWPKNRDKHLLAVCRALQFGFTYSIDFAIIRGTNFRAAAYAADAADDAAAAAAARAAAYAAYAADVADVAADVARAADSDVAIRFIRQELEYLADSPDVAAYLDNPTPLPFPEHQKRFLDQLRGYPGFDYWADWFQDRYEGKPPNRDLLEKSVNLPDEVLAQEPQAINRYLAALSGGEKEEKIKRVRAIFIGNGEAGKTSLIQALNGQAVTQGGTGMTPGVEISEWPVAGTDLTAHFWDFGGQVIAHATHQFFLRARCVYVLVLNARATDNNPNQQAEYWLEFVRAFGADAPVLLVGNKSDLTPAQVDIHRLRETYPNVRDLYPLSATQYTGGFARQFEIFRDAFIEELTRAGQVQPYFSGGEFAVIEALRAKSRQNPFLGKGDFDAECTAHGIDADDKRQAFLELLDQLGEVIHFPALYKAGFREYLLNPRWLTHGIYRLLYSDLLKDRHGALRDSDVRELLEGRQLKDEYGNILTYPTHKLDFLTRAMAEFRLCYPSPDQHPMALDKEWIVPDLLPSDQPADLDFHGKGALRFDFRFQTFLPRHVLGMFIVEYYQDIRGRQAWQHGVCLASRALPGACALVRADYQSRMLRLTVVGDHIDGYFWSLYGSVSKILERMPRLQYTKYLHLDEDARLRKSWGLGARLDDQPPTADFDDLLAAKANGDKRFSCKFGTYDLAKLLRGVPAELVRVTGPVADPGDAIGVAGEGGGSGTPRWSDILGALGGLGSLVGGLLTIFASESKVITSMAAVVGTIGAVGLIVLLIWRWPRIKPAIKRRLRDWLLDKLSDD